jgi:hypothetical protein
VTPGSSRKSRTTEERPGEPGDTKLCFVHSRFHSTSPAGSSRPLGTRAFGVPSSRTNSLSLALAFDRESGRAAQDFSPIIGTSSADTYRRLP